MIGFVNLFKAAGPSSARAVARVRRIYALRAGDRRLSAGHMGTLDPQAAGVLPVAIGKATRLIPLLADQRKSYAFTLVLGRSTTTQDAHGETVGTGPLPKDWAALLEAALPAFIGRIAQTPPMFSAVHHQGKRLYELAREGKSVERKRAHRHDLWTCGCSASSQTLRSGRWRDCGSPAAREPISARSARISEVQSGSRRIWERCCAKGRGRSCSTRRARSMKIAQRAAASADRARAHHSVSDDRTRPARVGRFSRRARRSAAARRDRTTRLRSRRDPHARRRRRGAGSAARAAQSFRVATRSEDQCTPSRAKAAVR